MIMYVFTGVGIFYLGIANKVVGDSFFSHVRKRRRGVENS